jgi:hypothetical protein
MEYDKPGSAGTLGIILPRHILLFSYLDTKLFNVKAPYES